MVHILHYSLAFLSAVLVATSNTITSPQDEERSPSSEDSAPALASDYVSAEVKPDGSVFSKWEVAESSVESKKEYQSEKDVLSNDDTDPVLIEEVEDARGKENPPLLRFVNASEAFLTLEKRIADEGYSPEVVEELTKMANTEEDSTDSEMANDWAFALTELSFMQLFEPNVESTEQYFIDAIHNLYVAADVGVQSASGVLSILALAGISPEQVENSNDLPLSFVKSKEQADEILLELLARNDFMATLAIAYGTESGRVPVSKSNPGMVNNSDVASNPETMCDAALSLFYLCAEDNVRIVAEEGGERPINVVRLSDELLNPYRSSFDDDAMDPANEENEVLHELDYYRNIANNPMDEHYPEALQHLGEIYFFGEPAAHIVADRQIAAQYFRQAAEAGHALAQANYAMLLANGMGVDQDIPQALVYFNHAAQQRLAFAFHGLGTLYFTGNGVPQNISRALAFFEEAIELGYAESHSFLGSVNLNGDGDVAIDYNKAFYHFQAAVEGTNGQSSQALFNLGMMYYRGIGTPPSCTLALQYIRPVALHPGILSSLPFSLVKAYECYKTGDYLRAYLHYRLVSELGDADGFVNAAFVLEHHGESILPWRWLGLANSSENSTTLVLQEAFKLYSLAAALNDSEAVRKTGICFHEPWEGVCPSNHTHALERYQLAAELGDTYAEYNCGLMLLTGDGVPQDIAAARTYYAKCSTASFPGNVPCALALLGIDILQTVKAAARFVGLLSA